jgi:superfamily II DNA/RNA helicase
MIAPRNQTLGEEIFSDIEKNEYLIELYSAIIHNYTLKVFNLDDKQSKEINIIDTLRFADLLSKSTYSEKHRELSQQIIALLHYLYPENEKVKLYAKSILEVIGNYRGLELIKSEYTNLSLLDDIFSKFDKHYLAVPFQDGKYFFHPQKAIYDRLNEESFSYSGPTSLGKSFLLRIFIKEKILNDSNGNFAILVPTKALISEITKNVINDLKETLNQKNYVVINSSGALALKDEHKYIFILTPERLLYLLISYPLINIDYLFIDEAHKISSGDERSAFYYKVTNMLSQREHKTNIVFASPNIPNPEEYLKLLPWVDNKKARSLITTFSPVSHLQYLVDLVDNNISIFNDLTNDFSDLPSFEDTLEYSHIGLIKHLSNHHSNKQSIIYCNSKASAIEFAREFASDLPDRNDDTDLLALANEIENDIHSDYYLPELIKKGVAFHVGYLPNYIRSDIETLYKNGKITTLFCTSTLVEGVNLPADNLFVMSYKRATSNMTSVEFKNLIGRVGRIEYNLFGNVFLVRYKENQAIDKYESLVSETIPEQKLSLLSSLSKGQKQKIIESLSQGDVKLLKYPQSQTEDNYALMRKFALILLRDITTNSHSVVIDAFESLLNEDVIHKIRKKFLNDQKHVPDDDINVSIDQNKRLSHAISEGLTYPPLQNSIIDYHQLVAFLEELSSIFMWEFYERGSIGKTNEHGQLATLRWYAVILNQWMTGYGLNQIITKAIEYKQNNDNQTIRINGSTVNYEDTREHRNIVISDTLNLIDNIILFKLSNYFLRFSTEFKKFHGIEDSFDNDWYEYVEYGSTNKLTIFLQRNGFTRETATYIRTHKDLYVHVSEEGVKLKIALLDCNNATVRQEVTQVFYNLPSLFI